MAVRSYSHENLYLHRSLNRIEFTATCSETLFVTNVDSAQ